MTQISTTDFLSESEDQLFRQAQQDDFDRQVAEEHEQMVKYRDAWYAVINAIGNVPDSGVLDDDTQLEATLKMIAKLKSSVEFERREKLAIVAQCKDEGQIVECLTKALGCLDHKTLAVIQLIALAIQPLAKRAV